MMLSHVSCLGTKLNRKEMKKKVEHLVKGKETPACAHCVVAHCNIGVTEDLINASLASWKDAWLLDSGATFHMNFKRDFFLNSLSMLTKQSIL